MRQSNQNIFQSIDQKKLQNAEKIKKQFQMIKEENSIVKKLQKVKTDRDFQVQDFKSDTENVQATTRINSIHSIQNIRDTRVQSIQTQMTTITQFNHKLSLKKINFDKQRTSSNWNEKIQCKSQRNQSNWNFLTSNSNFQNIPSKQNKAKNEQLIQNLKLQKQLDQSKENIIIDKEQKELVGEKAVQDYYKHYKQLDKINDQNNFNKTQQSLFTNLFQSFDKNNLMPSKLGIVKCQGEIDRIDIAKQSFGDKYINIFGNKDSLPKLKAINFSGNRITEKSSKNFLQQIDDNIIEMDLSNNRIGHLGSLYIKDVLFRKDNNLQILNLEDNNLGDKSVKAILEPLTFHFNIRILNLSKNRLTDNITEPFKEILGSENTSLQELYLYWNSFKGQSMQKIFQPLIQNQQLKVLDLSYNSLGVCSQQDLKCLLDTFIKNTQLVHLDLSNNKFNFQDCKSISNALNVINFQLKKNKTIYGFHFNKNYGYVDQYGYLILENYTNDVQLTSQRINSIKPILTKNITNCWICNQWFINKILRQEFTFVWRQQKNNEIHGAVYLHTDFDNYDGYYMGQSSEQTLKQLRIMPKRQINYFFTVQGQIQKQLQLKLIKNYRNLNIDNIKIINHYIDKQEIFNFHTIMNTSKKQLFDQYYNQYVLSIPRSRNQESNEKKRPQWLLKNSVFRDWKQDNYDLAMQCFEEDWKRCKIPKLIKDEQDLINTKKFFENIYYPFYKDTYKYFAAKDPVGDIFAITNISFNDLIDQSEVVDGKNLSQADVQIKLTSTLSNQENKGNPRTPQLGLVRFQLIEIMYRIADEKYLKKKICQTNSEACQMLYRDHFEQIFIKFHHQQWRKNIYWTEENDLVLKNNKQLLDQIFNLYSKRKVKPGQKRFVSLEEFIEIFRISDLLLYNIKQQDLNIAYSLSIMTQVDEIKSERNSQMQYVEFLEGLARVAEILQIQSCYQVEQFLFQEKEQTSEEKMNQPLHIKLLSMLIYLNNSEIAGNKFPTLDQPLFIDNEINTEYY